MKDLRKSKALFEKALQFIPGGVNSPVRAFKAVGGDPVFIKKASGAYLWDEDDNQYVDLINSWGPMILGHAHPIIETAVRDALSGSPSFGAPTAGEVEIAELICSMVPSIEKVRLVNSGTEATMSAVRLARGYTKRSKIIKMEGCYHGHADSFLIAAGSGALTLGKPDSPGVTKGVAQDTLIAPYNNLKAVSDLLDRYTSQVAAVILEPVAGNMGCVLPAPGYLEGLRTLCDRSGALLIFDEVMTGFRLARGGAQELFMVTPDLTTLGKIIGGGLPVGAFGGKKEIMDRISPQGPVYQAGTLSGNPLAVAAGLATLRFLSEHKRVYEALNKTCEALVNGMKKQMKDLGLSFKINRIGSMFTLFFTQEDVKEFNSATTSDTKLFARFFHSMLSKGVYFPPSQFESLFLSMAIGKKQVEEILAATEASFKEISSK